jgi:hypothetical protein
MESDQRYYWRRAAEEIAAASRAVTPAARLRHQELAETYVRRLRDLSTEGLERLERQLPQPSRLAVPTAAA